MSDALRVASRPSGAEVVVEGDRVIKCQDPFAARCERQRTEWGERVGRESGLFHVPRVLDFDAARGQIVFERIADGRMFGDALHAGVPAEPLMRRQGQALAAIHGALVPEPRPEGGDIVSLHGDFCYVNVFHSAAADQLWVIDWCNAYWLGMPAEHRFGSSSLDLAAFLISLFCHRFLVARAIPDIEGLAGVFLSSYAAGRNGRFRLSTLRADLPGYARQWREARRVQAGWLGAAWHGPGLGQLQRFMDRVELVTP